MKPWVINAVLAVAAVVGAALSPATLALVLSIGGAAAALAGAIARVTPNHTDDSIVGFVEALLAKLAGVSTVGKKKSSTEA